MRRATRMLLAFSCCGLWPATASSEEIVWSGRWQELMAARAVKSGVVIPASEGADGPSLRVAHQRATSATFPLVVIERPAITATRYALRGRVRYDGVAAASYLEMWSHLPEGAFFSRTLGTSGPMQRLEGSSAWRAFELPFNREGGSPPRSLAFNLVLAGAGTVDIGPLELVQFTADENPVTDSNAWWSDERAVLLGATVGSALGILGAIVGWLGSAGRARTFVLGALQTIAWLGVGALALGALALVRGQSYAVYYPLLLLGSISAALGFTLPRTLRKRYEQLELRRIDALDA